MNELFYLQSPIVKRRVRAKKFAGRRHTSSEQNALRTPQSLRRLSDSNLCKFFCTFLTNL